MYISCTYFNHPSVPNRPALVSNKSPKRFCNTVWIFIGSIVFPASASFNTEAKSFHVFIVFCIICIRCRIYACERCTSPSVISSWNVSVLIQSHRESQLFILGIKRSAALSNILDKSSELLADTALCKRYLLKAIFSLELWSANWASIIWTATCSLISPFLAKTFVFVPLKVRPCNLYA